MSFSASSNPAHPIEVWAGDVTYIATYEGWAYPGRPFGSLLAPPRRLGDESETNDTRLALETLHRAVRCRGGVPVGLVHHTDRGSPYASDDYRRAHRQVPRHGRGHEPQGRLLGQCRRRELLRHLRAELVDHERYALDSRVASIGQYIDAFYNVERLHSHLDYVSPIEFELKTRMNQFAA